MGIDWLQEIRMVTWDSTGYERFYWLHGIRLVTCDSTDYKRFDWLYWIRLLSLESRKVHGCPNRVFSRPKRKDLVFRVRCNQV